MHDAWAWHFPKNKSEILIYPVICQSKKGRTIGSTEGRVTSVRRSVALRTRSTRTWDSVDLRCWAASPDCRGTPSCRSWRQCRCSSRLKTTADNHKCENSFRVVGRVWGLVTPRRACWCSFIHCGWKAIQFQINRRRISFQLFNGKYAARINYSARSILIKERR